MHALDILIAVFAAIFIFTGIKRGLIGEVIRLTAMVAGCVIAFMYYHDAARVAPISHIPVQQEIRNGVAFILIYIISALAIIGAGWFIKKAVHLTPLGWIDRLIGALIGLLKALLIAYVACLSISSLPARRIRNDFNRSIVYRSFTALPNGMSLKSLLKKRNNLRTIFNKKPPAEIDQVHKKIRKFKTSIDSAKEAQSSEQ